ncbi:hypothetical protein R1flu_017106 [Riccia fluitans]|uniref:Uncharacterized protein n=1 Tax=Riccia fluitans TaxID=41844 RepID=A0ABD1YNT4_9MARC
MIRKEGESANQRHLAFFTSLVPWRHLRSFGSNYIQTVDSESSFCLWDREQPVRRKLSASEMSRVQKCCRWQNSCSVTAAGV